MPKPGKKFLRILLVVVAVLGLAVAVLDFHQFAQKAKTVHIPSLVLAVVASFGSFAFVALCLGYILKVLGAEIRFRQVFPISYVSMAINCIVSTGGAGGLTARAILLKRKNVEYGTSLLASIVSILIANTVLLVFVIVGFAWVLFSGRASLAHDILAVIIIGISIFAVVLCLYLMFHPEMRARVPRRLLSFANRIHRLVWRRDWFSREAMEEGIREFGDGIEVIREKKRNLILPTFYIFVDWLFVLLCLHCCFGATGGTVPSGVLVVGFALGLFVSLISLIPGGLGVMEGSMAAVYASLGVPLEDAVLAVLLFRVVHNGIPFLISMTLFRPLFKESRESPGKRPEVRVKD